MGVSAAAVASPRAGVDIAAAGTFVAGAVTVASLAAANGGYFPGSWGWASLAAAWLAAGALLLRRDFALGRLEFVFLGALGALPLWFLLSTLWSQSVPSTVFEVERALVAATGAAAVLLVVQRRTVPSLLGGVLAGIVLVGVYALGTRLFPDRIGTYDPVAGYRLAEPLGYWNGLGIFSVLGILLALGFAARGRSIGARMLGAFVLPVLAATVYFTFSRGALIALGFALIVAVVLDARRVQLVSVGLLVGLPSALAVWLASRRDTLTTVGAAVSAAAHDGHAVAAIVTGCAVLAAAFVLLAWAVERGGSFGRRVRLGYAAALVAVAAGLLVALLVHYGGPVDAVQRGWDSFTAPPARVTGSLNQRLFSFSSNGRIDLWSEAWHESRAHPWLGGGAGSFEQWWNAHRTVSMKVRDAHSLYVETLAELGPIGLGLLALVLALPLVAAVRARRRALVSTTAAAYFAYLLHAALDWDWELSGLTLAAFLCGAALLVAARREGRAPVEPRPAVRYAGVAVALVVGAASVVALVGNTKLARAASAAGSADWTASAARARSAADWMPWASEPWRLLGEAQLGEGRPDAAAASFRKAIAKDSGDWRLWLDLARVTSGRSQARALAEAERLNPRSPEIRQLKDELAAGGTIVVTP